MRDTHREKQRHRQREKQVPCREPDVGLYPGSPGSHPGLQVALNRCTTGATQLIYFLKRFYLFIHERYRERQRHRQREKQAPGREPDAGLHPRTLGSCPESKADTQPLSSTGAPGSLLLRRQQPEQRGNIKTAIYIILGTKRKPI